MSTPFDEDHVRREWNILHREWDDITCIQYKKCVRCHRTGSYDTSYNEHLEKNPECLIQSVHGS